MKQFDKSTVSFGRHETFALRFGWLTKGYSAFKKSSEIFDSDEATVVLGVGKNMVSAIKYWMIASQILDNSSGKALITSFGKVIFDLKDGFDPYLEDDATIWLLHWKIASNPANATTFFWFFNMFHKPEFSAKELTGSLNEFIREKLESKVADNTIKSDITLMLRMYESTITSKVVPLEEGLDSPMAALKLISSINDSKYHESIAENRWMLPVVSFTYAIAEVFLATKISSISLDRLMSFDGSFAAPGSVFCLNEEGLVAKIEEMILWLPGCFELRETAGIHQLYQLDPILPNEVLSRYYGANRNQHLEVLA